MPPNYDFNPPHPPPWREEADTELEGSRITPLRDTAQPFPLVRPASSRSLERVERRLRTRRILARMLFVILFGSVLALLAYEISIAQRILI
jgi:hypothetical protein